MKNILIVDDSALMRRTMSDIINSDEELHNDKYAVNGEDALRILEAGGKFDAIVLDINMPKMNGIEFLRALNRKGRKERVVIVSTIAREGAKETIQALELGAFDFITKPDSLSEAKGPSFNQRLIEMLYAAIGLRTSETSNEDVKKKLRPAAKPGSLTSSQGTAMARRTLDSGTRVCPGGVSDRTNHSKAPAGKGTRKLVALACSTGGPKALQYVVPFLPANLDAPVLIVQHMPEGFTSSLSKRLDELSKITVKEAADGDVLKKGTVYIAKGGSQMRLAEKSRSEHVITVRKEAARNGLKPCADIMYESLMETSFDEITCVVMTGMGADGTQGILQLEKTNKVYVIGQDAESCTVYGMPKAIAETGAVDEVVTLKGIADAITKHVGVL
ncbi:MAG: chemotaxis-specific protein-glutamate methyltransferase CheB [Lachnospiraceae bacterium]|nr:chemotaxis-specific protein-glutamate methyltransferase CheB [Lachnospiraceae bacterium]